MGDIILKAIVAKWTNMAKIGRGLSIWGDRK